MEIKDATILSYTKNPVPESKPKVYDFSKDDDVISYLLDKAFISQKDKIYTSCSGKREDGTFEMRVMSNSSKEDYKVKFNSETNEIEKELYVRRSEDTVETPNEGGS
jgi:hypothetical protein